MRDGIGQSQEALRRSAVTLSQNEDRGPFFIGDFCVSCEVSEIGGDLVESVPCCLLAGADPPSPPLLVFLKWSSGDRGDRVVLVAAAATTTTTILSPPAFVGLTTI
ncbi:hypothetical protein AAHC03_024238 [Spirometra sp. Aus1]